MSTPVGRTTNGFYSRARASVAARSVGSRRCDRDTALTPSRGGNDTVERSQKGFGTYAPGMLLEDQQVHLSGESDLENSYESDVYLTPSASSVSPHVLPRYTPSNDYSRVISLLQQQQVALQQLFSGQKSLEERQDHVEG